MTVKGGQTLLSDNFNTDSQWTTVQGIFSVSAGVLTCGNSGDNVRVNSSSTNYGDVTINVNVRNNMTSNEDASIVLRYQNTSNFYLVMPYGNTLRIYEKLNGTYNLRAQGTIPTITAGTWYGLRIDAKGGQITAYWNNAQIVTWTDTSPWTTGKVGFRKGNGISVSWDNFYVWSDGNGNVTGFDDYYPFGSIMPGSQTTGYRSQASTGDGRYKLTSKERDTETGYDYFGTRYVVYPA